MKQAEFRGKRSSFAQAGSAIAKRSRKALVTWFAASAAAFALAACSSTPGGGGLGQGIVSAEGIAAVDPTLRPAVAFVDGQPALLYATKVDNANHVVFREGDRQVILDQALPVKGGSFYQLHVDGDRVVATWWSHEQSKAVYIAVSDNGGKTFFPATVLVKDGGVLPPYYIAHGAGERLTAVYGDEREPKYEIYTKTSADGGRTWPTRDARFDVAPPPSVPSFAMFPQFASAGRLWLVAWQDLGNANDTGVRRVMYRVSTDAGTTWSPQQVLMKTGDAISALTLRHVGQSFVLSFIAGTTEMRTYVSPDSGIAWTAVSAVANADESSVSDVQIAGGTRRAVFAWVSQKASEKPQIRTAVLDLQTRRWLGAPIRLDVKADTVTKSISPRLASLGGDRFVAAWVDYRNILPNVYLSTSADGGKTWSAPENTILDAQASMFDPSLIVKANSLYLGYFRQTTPKITDFVIDRYSISPEGKIAGLPQQHQPTKEQKYKQLEQRVAAFWALRAKGEYAKTYSYFDPVFRSGVTEAVFAKQQANAIFKHPAIAKATLNGNVASVDVKALYIPPKITIQGKPFDIPTREIVTHDTWVWIGNEWYFVYTGFFHIPDISY